MRFPAPQSRPGGIMVLTVLAFSLMLVSAGAVVDLAALYFEHDKLQAAVDAAALAGAQELPSHAQAESVAAQYLQANGEGTAGVVFAYNASNTRFTVTRTKPVPTAFVAIAGLATVPVSASATGEQAGPGGAFDSAIFSGSELTNLSMNGSSYTIKGKIHTNRNLVMNGSNATVTKDAEAAGTITVNGTNIAMPNRSPGAAVVDTPDLSAGLKAAAQAAGQSFIGSRVISGSQLTTSAMYVQGAITANGSGFNATGTIMADQSININGSGTMVSGGNQVAFYSRTGDVILNGSNLTFNGVLYAPNGRVIINGSNVTINGSIVGDSVIINGSGVNVNREDNAIKVLGSTHVKLTL